MRDAELSALYAEAAAATSTGSKSFYFATKFFPPDLAKAAHAVYWFCRVTDDLVDEASSLEQGRADITNWQQELVAGFAGKEPQSPILRLFINTVQQYKIPHEYPLDLIDGVKMDLESLRYESFDELRVFCYRVASTVGLMMMHVIGFEGDPREYATDLGIAMQLTNILRDVGADLDMGRVYLPANELARFGYSAQDLAARRLNEHFRELMKFEIARAHSYYDRAMPGIANLNQRGRFAVQVAAEVYRQILSRIEKNDYQVFEKRAVVPPVEKYWITTKRMAVPIARHMLRKAL